jgi:uroporphyrinogen-III synthase
MPDRRSVLITRPAEDAIHLCEKLTANGFDPILAPMFRVIRRQITPPARVQALLVTSGNALASLPALPLPLLAVGDATAARAASQGFVDVRSAGADAVALAALASRSLDPGAGPVLLASGQGQGVALAADLRARGFRVVRRVCYVARPARRFPAQGVACIQSGRLHAAMFLSAETARHFVRLLPAGCVPALSTVSALAIGPSTADALESLPWLRICRARTPTLDDVLALI